MLLGQLTAHQRIQIRLVACKMTLAANQIRNLKNDLFNIGIVKEEHGRSQLIGKRNDRRRQFAEIRGLNQQTRDSLIHQRLKRVRNKQRVASGICQRRHDQIAAIEIRKLHARGIILKKNSRRDRSFQAFLSGNQSQILDALKPI